MATSAFRALPSVDRLLAEPRLVDLAARYGHERVAQQARRALDEARTDIGGGSPPPDIERLTDRVVARAATLWQPGLRRVINATGVVIHTNLGRAPLSEEACLAMGLAASGYSNLELDLASGERGSRHTLVESLLTELTGAEAGLVVNNNASAVLLGLTAMAQGREVIVSRGQAVEIGGGFRIPDVLRQSGAHLVEVGTTNRTYIGDYDGACTHETAAFLRVHSSNFRVIGFTHEAGVGALIELAKRRNVVVLDDVGSGCLLDTTRYGLGKEPTVQESVQAGADLVFFSGDKLLGGPQAGIVVGKRAAVAWLRRHPLARAVRIDKASLAGLAVTLVHYLQNEAEEKVPVWRMIARSLDSIDQQARAWAAGLKGAEVVDGLSMIGGGSLPEESLPTRLLSLDGSRYGSGAQELAARLRAGSPAVMARIERDRLLLDPRTVLPGEEEDLLGALSGVVGAH